jgi:hypothetical protein
MLQRDIMKRSSSFIAGLAVCLVVLLACSEASTQDQPAPDPSASDPGDADANDDATTPDAAHDARAIDDAGIPQCPATSANPRGVLPGGACLFNADCCSGVCNVQQRNLYGTCVSVDAGLVGTCRGGGQHATVQENCCSGSAVDQTCTGDPQPAHGHCRATALACRTDKDCCGSNCQLDTMTGDGSRFCQSLQL